MQYLQHSAHEALTRQLIQFARSVTYWMRVALYMQATPWLDPSDTADVFEVRIYSLGRKSFGTLLQRRRIRAAHCLTSVQFSPTSQHLLLAYGRCGLHGCSHAPPAHIAWLVSKFAKIGMQTSL